ncbi:MAG: LptF/LptG family permease [Candidatus Zixiibacteriota bacterium]
MCHNAVCFIEGPGIRVYIRHVNRLDRYILREHNGPFWFAFVVTTLVLVVDFVPDVVSMVVSKGLAPLIIIQVFVLNLAWMLALSVPMAVLSGTLMAFGRLAGDFEILAAKAAGISVYRMIAPVLIAAAILGAGLVLFNNEVLPDANHKARLLMSDIRRKRPTLDLKPNVMEDRIPGYHLLIREVDRESSRLAGVTIFEHRRREAPRTVVANTGNMSYSADGTTLILELFDGEIHEADPNNVGEYRRTEFERQTFYLGGAGDQFSRTKSEYRTDREKSAAQMREDVAAWRESITPHLEAIDMACSLMVAALFLAPPDSMGPYENLPLDNEDFIPAATDLSAVRRARDRAARIGTIIHREVQSIKSQERLIRQYEIEIQKKYSIPAACVVFVLLGCPLAVRTRRGGIGVAIGMSLGLFLIYWAFLIAGEDLADRGLVSPFVAMWSADITIGTVGLLLLWSVTNEASLTPSALIERAARWFNRGSDGTPSRTKLS